MNVSNDKRTNNPPLRQKKAQTNPPYIRTHTHTHTYSNDMNVSNDKHKNNPPFKTGKRLSTCM